VTQPTYRDAARGIEVRARDLLERMTLEEKVAQMTAIWMAVGLQEKPRTVDDVRPLLQGGIGEISRIVGSAPIEPAEGARTANEIQRLLVEETRLGVPAIVHEECLAGLMAKGATVFPQAIALGSSFDPELVERVTSVIRRQMRAVGAHQGLAPVLDVARDPRWGRIEETLGEDPYLVSRLGHAYVRGLQGDDARSGVLATLKHFAGYSSSEGGRNLAPAHVGPRELREVFFFPFEVAIRSAGAASVMNAYMEIDGVPVAASRELLTDVLREEWGFEGLVVADYYSIEFLHLLHRVARDETESAVLSVRAGIDVELPNPRCYAEPLVAAVEAGRVSIEEIDAIVSRILGWKLRLGLFESPYVDPDAAASVFDTPEDRALAREAARRSIVLLRNEGGLLPLGSSLRTLAVIGPNADRPLALFGDYHFSNHLALEAPSVETRTVLEAIRARIGDDVEILASPGCGVEEETRDGFADAVRAARAAEVAIVVLGDHSGALRQGTVGEHRDSDTLALPGVQEELLREICATGTPVLLLLLNGRPFAMEWIAENVPAIVEAWFPGEEGADAIVDVLFGHCSPSARLPVTVPRRPGHAPLAYNQKFLSRKDYVTSAIAPLFPFGHGLSYTRFEYEDLRIEPDRVAPDGTVEIACRVQNVGDRSGEEVVQLYIRDPVASCVRPVQELKGFARVELEPGQSRTVRFRLPTDLVAFYDPELRLVVEPGEIEVRMGASSEDIRLRSSFVVEGDTRVIEGARRYETEVRIDP
jgi:beta-glucosidase